MRLWTKQELLNRWDETIVVSMFAFLMASPLKPPREVIMTNMMYATHVMEELAERGIPLSEMHKGRTDIMSAAKRMGVPEVGMRWLEEQLV